MISVTLQFYSRKKETKKTATTTLTYPLLLCWWNRKNSLRSNSFLFFHQLQ